MNTPVNPGIVRVLSISEGLVFLIIYYTEKNIVSSYSRGCFYKVYSELIYSQDNGFRQFKSSYPHSL